MPCYRPIPAAQDKPGGVVKLHPPVGTATMQLPCGRCLGCRKRRAKEWATRCMHEASLHEHNCFITLTYDDEHLPANGFLEPKHLQDFFKRLRWQVTYGSPHIVGYKLRYVACGEYGDRSWRAHYHALLFGINFTDLYPVKKDLFTSECLRKLWKHGMVSVGTVTPRSAMYVAQYSLKKQSKTRWAVHDEDGVVAPQPFLRCSLKPGIGKEWLIRYHSDLEKGYVAEDGGYKNAVPAYYQRIIKEVANETYLAQRVEAAKRFKPIQSERLAAGEVIAARFAELSNPRSVSTF